MSGIGMGILGLLVLLLYLIIPIIILYFIIKFAIKNALRELKAEGILNLNNHPGEEK